MCNNLLCLVCLAAQWQRDNPDLAERQAEFFHSLWDDPGGAVAKEELLGSRLTTGTSVASATATTCCAAGACAVCRD